LAPLGNSAVTRVNALLPSALRLIRSSPLRLSEENAGDVFSRLGIKDDEVNAVRCPVPQFLHGTQVQLLIVKDGSLGWPVPVEFDNASFGHERMIGRQRLLDQITGFQTETYLFPGEK
jgi:hypothetical protein